MKGTLFLLTALLFGSWLLGQEPAEDQPEFKIGVAVDQIFLSVTARHREGGFFKGLEAKDFQVLEDGVEQEIVNFTQEAVPVSAVLLIDASGSTTYLQSSIRTAALKFCQSLGKEDRVAIITFNDAPRLILDWTNEVSKVEYALETIYAKGPTVMNDALYVTFDDLLRDVEGKKAVMLLTDGVDTGSMVHFDQAIDLAVRSEAIVYAASKLEEYRKMAAGQRQMFRARGQLVPNELTENFIMQARRDLLRMTELTGGRVLETQVFESLSKVYELVAEELKNQYYLSYTPSNSNKDGTWREIEVRPRRLGLVLKTRKGYFAPTAP